jgi:hypothetical protein
MGVSPISRSPRLVNLVFTFYIHIQLVRRILTLFQMTRSESTIIEYLHNPRYLFDTPTNTPCGLGRSTYPLVSQYYEYGGI